VLFIGFFLGAKPLKTGEDDFAEEAPKRSALLRYPLTSVGITVAATLGVEPIVAYYFHYSSIISPLANLIVTPLVCMVLVPLSVAGSFTYLLSGSFPLESLTGWVAETAISLVKTSAAVPYSWVPVPSFPLAVLFFYYIGFLLYFIFRDKRFIAIPVFSIVVPLSVVAFSGNNLSVTFLDAGRGDASVVELPDGKTVVVDAGRRGKEVRRYLRHRGIQGIDALVLTHADYYHTGGAATLVEQIGAEEIWDNGMLEYPEDFPGGTKRRGLKRGDVIEGEGYTISVLHPYDGFLSGSGRKGAFYNDNSLVLKVQGREHSVLFAGDIGAGAMRDVALIGEHLKSDVIKLSDHGRWGTGHEEFFKNVSPSVVVARGKPDEDMERYLEGTRIYYTGVDGAVRVEGKDGGLGIKTYDEITLKETRSPAEELRNFRRLFGSW
jgi:competence protein ComEC